MPQDNGAMAIKGQSRSLIAMLLLVLPVNMSSISTRALGDTVGALSPRDHAEVATDARFTTDQQELLDFALSRFEGQGLVLPQVDVEFVAEISECQGHKGLYWAGTRTLRMCSMDKKTLLHELAHAWANLNLTDTQRERFAELRGLEVWNDSEYDWEERATEHAAEIIAWALMDRPVHVRYVTPDPDGRQRAEYRLLTIDDTSVEEMCHAFVALTGRELVYRNAGECDSELLEIEWQARMATFSSPEARG